MADKNKITGPMDPAIPVVHVYGVPFLIVADLPEGGYLQVVSGLNPMTPATPSVGLAKGSMLAVVPVEVANQIRPGLKAVAKELAKGIVNGGPAS